MVNKLNTYLFLAVTCAFISFPWKHSHAQVGYEDPCPCMRDTAVSTATGDATETVRRIALMLSGNTPPRHPNFAIMPAALEEARKTLPNSEACGPTIRLGKSDVTSVDFKGYTPSTEGRNENWVVMVRGQATRVGCATVGVSMKISMNIPFPAGSGGRIARVESFAFTHTQPKTES